MMLPNILRTCRDVGTAATLAVGMLGWAANAEAGAQIFDLSAGPNWRTTVDPLLWNQWARGNFSPNDGVAATAPYSNRATTDLNENKMMWSCGLGGSSCPFDNDGYATGGGPTEAFFALSFDVTPVRNAPLVRSSRVFDATLAIIADDFFDLVINGQHVVSATLDDNKKPDGQPAPLILDFTTLAPYFEDGQNVLAVRALDGFLLNGQSCGGTVTTTNLGDFCKTNRLYEYLFISGSAEVVPEPGSLVLLGFGLAGVAFLGRGSRHAK